MSTDFFSRKHEVTPQRIIWDLLGHLPKCNVCNSAATRTAKLRYILWDVIPFCDTHSVSDRAALEHASVDYTDLPQSASVRIAQKWLDEHKVEEKT